MKTYKKIKVSLTEDELIGVLQLVNESISERKCNKNELRYMGLLSLKNKLQLSQIGE